MSCLWGNSGVACAEAESSVHAPLRPRRGQQLLPHRLRSMSGANARGRFAASCNAPQMSHTGKPACCWTGATREILHHNTADAGPPSREIHVQYRGTHVVRAGAERTRLQCGGGSERRHRGTRPGRSRGARGRPGDQGRRAIGGSGQDRACDAELDGAGADDRAAACDTVHSDRRHTHATGDAPHGDAHSHNRCSRADGAASARTAERKRRVEATTDKVVKRKKENDYRVCLC